MNVNKFSKFSRISIIFVLLVTLFGFISINPLFAKENDGNQQSGENNRDYCFCHNQNNNPQTLCFKDSNDDFGHLKHVSEGKDSFGRCGVTPPIEPPSVPEFGLITGSMALLSSGGVAYIFRKRH